jgi:hypothetical protein
MDGEECIHIQRERERKREMGAMTDGRWVVEGYDYYMRDASSARILSRHASECIELSQGKGKMERLQGETRMAWHMGLGWTRWTNNDLIMAIEITIAMVKIG